MVATIAWRPLIHTTALGAAVRDETGSTFWSAVICDASLFEGMARVRAATLPIGPDMGVEWGQLA
jgi:hypothetical protein